MMEDVAEHNLKVLLPREWIFQKILHCINTRGTAKTCGLLIIGGAGSGKTTVCAEICLKNNSNSVNIQKLRSMIFGYHFCSGSSMDSLNLAKFILKIRECILNIDCFKEIYRMHMLSSGVSNLFNQETLCNYPDKVFKNGILLPLLSFPPPKQNMFLLIDSVDESLLSNYFVERKSHLLNYEMLNDSAQGSSRNISDLLSAHHNFFPEWLSLICTCRKESQSVIRKFLGFRKFQIDDLNKSYIIRDIQLYILNRIDSDSNLSKIINNETPELLNLLHIKSNGYILYLEIILDLICDNYINIKSIRFIPGTLSGLYLWIFETIFSQFPDLVIVKHIFNVILSSLQALSEQEIFSALLNFDIGIECSFIKNLLSLMKYFFKKVQIPTYSSIQFRHHSLADWLLDVKLCTPKYKCSLVDGHGILTLFYTFHSSKLSHLSIRHFGFHLVSSAPIFQFKGYHFVAWLLYSDCDLEIDGFSLNDNFGSLCDWNFDKVVRNLFNSFSMTDTALSSFLMFSKVISTITSLYSKKADSGTNVSKLSLHEATRKDNYEAVFQLIMKDADANKTNSNGTTALMIACQCGFVSICQLLLSAGASQYFIDKDGWSALRLAIWNGHKDTVEILLSQGINTDYTGPDGRTALRTAAWVGRTDIALMLLAAGADINKPDSEGRTPLMAATYKCNYTIMKELIKKGANVNHRDNDGRSAIFVATLCLNINNKYLDVIKLLVKSGAQVNVPDNDGMTPLLIGSYEGNKTLCEFLLENNADIDVIDRNSRTPLMASAYSGHYENVKLLLFWGAAIHCIDKNGYSVLSISACQGNSLILSELLARGLDEMHRDNNGATPLHLSSIEGHSDCVSLLLKVGAKPNETDNIGRIPLMLACQEGHLNVIQILVTFWPESVNFKSFDGSTALKIAVLNGWPELVAYLLKMGSDITSQDNYGRIPLHISILQSQFECFQIILNYLLRRNISLLDWPDDDARSAMHIAAWKGEESMIQNLIKAGARLDLKDKEGRTSLHLAAWQGNHDICEMLLKSGSEVDAACSQGATALSIAAQEGHLKICSLLINWGSNIWHVDSYMRTPYKVAFKGKHLKICKLLENKGALVKTNLTSTGIIS